MSVVNSEMIANMYITCTYCIRRFAQPDWGFRKDICNFYNILFIIGGKGIFEKNGVTQAVKKADIVFFEKGCIRSLSTDKNEPLKFYTVNFECVLPEFKDHKWTLTEPKLNFDFIKTVTDKNLFNRFSSLFERLINVRITPEQQSNQREIMNKILDTYTLLYSDNVRFFALKKKIDRTVEYMYKYYADKITLEGLASVAELSASYYSMVFKSLVGSSPIDFLIHVRTERAKEFLSGGMSISQTANTCGFSDIYYFSTMFKKLESMTPTQYIAYIKSSDLQKGYLY